MPGRVESPRAIDRGFVAPVLQDISGASDLTDSRLNRKGAALGTLGRENCRSRRHGRLLRGGGGTLPPRASWTSRRRRGGSERRKRAGRGHGGELRGPKVRNPVGSSHLASLATRGVRLARGRTRGRVRPG